MRLIDADVLNKELQKRLGSPTDDKLYEVNLCIINAPTIEDMHKAEEDAYSKGVKDGKDGAVKTVFAAICLTLHELHGFGKERCSKVLNDVYDKLQFTLTSQEAIQEVYDTIGLQINFHGDVTEDAVTEVGA